MKRVLFLTLILLPSSLLAADLTGAFPRGERYEAPSDHAPAAVSRMFVRTMTRDAKSVDLPATGDGSMIVWTIPARTNGASARPLGARLTTPTGDVLRPQQIGSTERGLRRFRFDSAEVGLDLPRGEHEVLHVMRTEAANYRLDADVPNDVAGVMVVAAEPDSRITLETWVTPLSRQPGVPITLHARLRDGEDAIENANVTARLAAVGRKAGAPIELIDADHDGVYTAKLNELPHATHGVWQARFEASGATASDVRFARTGSGEFVAERGAARLIADSIRTSRSNGVLRITASADVAIPGAYRFDVIVAGAEENGARAALAWGEGVRQLERGANEMTLEIPIEANNEQLHLDVRLLGLDEIGVAGRVAVDVR